MSDMNIPIPPATFEFLILSLKFQAESHLGLLYFGDEKDRPEPSLDLARHTIDMLAMLQGKTKGNLSSEEQRLVENTITELRFRYVYASEQAAKKSSEPAPQSAPEEPAPENKAEA
ncbi:MAG TPA: DUF1844 domain-containing protein [Bryobacteraceae bacterium]|jgi:hypothetical protein|nr:DUF1844 domain-containing protein [Bryobacteraceae bacterium]